MPLSALEITEKFMNKPLHLLIKNNELTLEGIKQFYVALDSDSNKFACLTDLYNSGITNKIMYLVIAGDSHYDIEVSPFEENIDLSKTVFAK